MGAVYNEVLAEAQKMGADLIVVGSHRPGMATYLLGSNASTIVRHAPSSVLVVSSISMLRRSRRRDTDAAAAPGTCDPRTPGHCEDCEEDGKDAWGACV
jgi:hypothetical protein